MSNLIRIEGYQTRLRGINPAYGRQEGVPLRWESLENCEGRHGTWCLGQVFHNNIVVGGPCVWIMCHVSKNALQGVKQCVKIWLLNMKRATRMRRRCCLMHNKNRLGCVIVLGLRFQIDHVFTHENIRI
jgi:hypothetical protein